MLDADELDEVLDLVDGLSTAALGRCIHDEHASFSSICTAVSTLLLRFFCCGLMSDVIILVVALVADDRFSAFPPHSLPFLSFMFCDEIEPFGLNRL
jgi:hypothetical protein